MIDNLIEIDLKLGKAWLKPYVTRKASREWKLALWEGAQSIAQEDGDKPDFKFKEESATKAQDVLILNMLAKLEYNGKTYEVITQEQIDDLDGDDFACLKDKSFEMLMSKSESKKK